jgi:hypothetical protein
MQVSQEHPARESSFSLDTNYRCVQLNRGVFAQAKRACALGRNGRSIPLGLMA